MGRASTCASYAVYYSAMSKIEQDYPNLDFSCQWSLRFSILAWRKWNEADRLLIGYKVYHSHKWKGANPQLPVQSYFSNFLIFYSLQRSPPTHREHIILII